RANSGARSSGARARMGGTGGPADEHPQPNDRPPPRTPTRRPHPWRRLVRVLVRAGRHHPPDVGAARQRAAQEGAGAVTTTAVRERPILFSGEMVRAILDGRKTQTRRVVRPQPWAGPLPGGKYEASGPWVGHDGIWRFMRGVVSRREDDIGRCPYGQPGDWLWVRETWGWRGSIYSVGADHKDQIIEYRADRERRYISRPISRRGRDGLPRHRARRPGESEQEYRHYLHRFWSAWRPSIHMPRWASRITLEITDVRVERLQDITEADIIAEGCTVDAVARWAGVPWSDMPTLHHAFRVGWDRLNARRGFGWDVHPWVWAITFRRLEAAS